MWLNRYIFSNTRQLSPDEILQQLKLPVFVKPNNGGSSIGMSKVNEAGELVAALEKAFNEDNASAGRRIYQRP
jgi:D-alanine-D-alanine ligase